jgi:hypothetical protein
VSNVFSNERVKFSESASERSRVYKGGASRDSQPDLTGFHERETKVRANVNDNRI